MPACHLRHDHARRKRFRDDPRRDSLASKHNKTGTCRIATKAGTQKFRDRPTPHRTWLFRTLANVLFDPYRPELRGAGPKWRAKYRRAR